MRKAVFGGTFDPIHNGHLHIAYEALYQLKLDKVLFMPSGNPPHKTENTITDANLRFELVKMAVSGEEHFEVSDFEIRKKGLSYTYETLKFFSEREPETDWYFITGVDCLMDLGYWKNVDQIMKYATFAVFIRPGYSDKEIEEQKRRMEDIYKKQIKLINLPILDISSSGIRNKIKKNENVSYLLPGGVYSTIMELGLYAKE